MSVIFILVLILLAIGATQVNKVTKIAEAFAKAEGFYAIGALPQRANNPGDLELGDQGNGTINGKTVFPSVAAGWAALYKEITLIITGTSKHYTPDMSIAQVAKIWTGGDASDSWAASVAESLGVTIDTPIKDV